LWCWFKQVSSSQMDSTRYLGRRRHRQFIHCVDPTGALSRDARGLTLHFTPSELLKGMLGKMLMGMPPL
jgi:hypothetical protein